eukprot:g45708.t1
MMCSAPSPHTTGGGGAASFSCTSHPDPGYPPSTTASSFLDTDSLIFPAPDPRIAASGGGGMEAAGRVQHQLLSGKLLGNKYRRLFAAALDAQHSRPSALYSYVCLADKMLELFAESYRDRGRGYPSS